MSVNNGGNKDWFFFLSKLISLWILPTGPRVGLPAHRDQQTQTWLSQVLVSLESTYTDVIIRSSQYHEVGSLLLRLTDGETEVRSPEGDLKTLCDCGSI